MTAEVNYIGNLRAIAKHTSSGKEIITDAPIDNHGKGEAFSPTELTATSLALCMITVMGILAENKKIDIDGTKAKVTRIMSSDPRRISEIKIEMQFPAGKDYSEKEREMLKNTAINCPVAKSLHPDIKQEVTFLF